jgi:hypothetical protein
MHDDEGVPPQKSSFGHVPDQRDTLFGSGRFLRYFSRPRRAPMISLSFRGTAGLVVALLILRGGTAFGQKQTPGQITQFDPSLNVVDSVITQDPSGNIGIGS